MQRVAEHWDALAPRRVLRVRYEDLVRDKVRAGHLPGSPRGLIFWVWVLRHEVRLRREACSQAGAAGAV